MTGAARIASVGALMTAAAGLASGPIAAGVVAAVHPQPPWQDAATFVAALHPIQMLPYLLALPLIAGQVLLVAGLHARAPEAMRARTSAALVFVAIYGALITFNYVLQTTFVLALAARATPIDAPVLAATTMANPRSLAWALEMWGYGASGVATWLVAPAIGGRAGVALRANGVICVAGALITVAAPGWVLTPAGLVMFVAWNLVIAIAAALVWIALSPRAIVGADDEPARDPGVRADGAVGVRR
jgi:hypothetical protein